MVLRLCIPEAEPRERKIPKSRNLRQTNRQNRGAYSSKPQRQGRKPEKSCHGLLANIEPEYEGGRRKRPGRRHHTEERAYPNQRRHIALRLSRQGLCALGKRSEGSSTCNRQHQLLLSKQQRILVRRHRLQEGFAFPQRKTAGTYSQSFPHLAMHQNLEGRTG